MTGIRKPRTVHAIQVSPEQLAHWVEGIQKGLKLRAKKNKWSKATLLKVMEKDGISQAGLEDYLENYPRD